MHAPAPFEVTPEALNVVAHLLRRHPEMQAALVLITGFDQADERGEIEAHFEDEHFMMGYGLPDRFSQWPRVELCGQNIPVDPDALERLKGHTLAIQVRDIAYIAGGKETRKFLVAA